MSGSGSESSGSSVRIRSNKNTHVIKIQIESESESLESTRLILRILNHESSQIQIYKKKIILNLVRFKKKLNLRNTG